jgi:enoyl-CoA hydratase/carnithine racemase
MTPRGFRYDEQGAIARVTLDRPETLNSLTFEVYRELTALMRGLAERPTVRVVVLTGAGRAF